MHHGSISRERSGLMTSGTIVESIRVGKARIAVRLALCPDYYSDVWLMPSVGEYPIYDASLYEVMADDAVRNDAYSVAIRRVVGGRRVLEVGTGDQALWARLAAECGASSVEAVEELDDAYASAERCVHDLGHGARIRLTRGSSFSLELPQRVDVCISEIIGTIASSEGALAVHRDAWARHLRLGATVIPSQCETCVAGVTLPDGLHAEPALHPAGAAYVEKIFALMGTPFDLRLCAANLRHGDLLTSHGVVEVCDFRAPADDAEGTEIELCVLRAGRLDGFVLWIRLAVECGGDVIDSFRQNTSWLPLLVPCCWPGREVEPGSTVAVRWKRLAGADRVHPDYAITAILDGAPVGAADLT